MTKKAFVFLFAFIPVLLKANIIVDGICYKFPDVGMADYLSVTCLPNGKYSGDIVIPEKIEYDSIEYPVLSIDSYAFSDCDELMSVSMPNTITNIGEYAFSNLPLLKSITLPDSLVYFAHCAFNNCTALECVNFNAVNLQKISAGMQLFCDCDSIRVINLGNKVEVIPSGIFENLTRVNTIAIPQSVKRIGTSPFKGLTNLTQVCFEAVNSVYEGDENNPMFAGCENISDVSIGDSVKSIPDFAFKSLDKITEIRLPETLTKIGTQALYGCSGLGKITIPTNVSAIGVAAFTDGTGLNQIEFNAVNCSYAGNENNPMFAGCENISAVSIGDSVKSIPDFAFKSLDKITEIRLPETLTKIGTQALYGCSGLGKITIPTNVSAIGVAAFTGGTGLNQIEFNAVNCSYAGDENNPMFAGCENISAVSIGDSVESIPDFAFKSLDKITEIRLPETLTKIGTQALYGCSGLGKITIPTNVSAIGVAAFTDGTGLNQIEFNAVNCSYAGDENNPMFAGCENISDVSIGDSVKSIPDFAFKSLDKITEIRLPETLTKIGKYAFYECSGLQTLVIPDSVTYIGDVAFKGCIGLNSVMLSDALSYIGASAFADCSEIKSLTIPENVTTIGAFAFNGWSKLEELKFNAINSQYGNYNYDFTNAMFNGSNNLSRVSIGDKVKVLPQRIFQSQAKLTEIILPSSLEEIKEFAFASCSGLTSITVPVGLKRICGSAFSECTGLNNIEIPESVIGISEGAFYGCTGLTDVVFNAISCKTELHSFAEQLDNWPNPTPPFYGCDSIEHITIGDKVKVIPQYAFEGFHKVIDIKLPDSVEELKPRSLNIPGLKTIKLSSNLKSIGFNALFGTELKEIDIPNSVTFIGEFAFSYSRFLENVKLGNSIEIISRGAFKGIKIRQITIPESVKTIGEDAFVDCENITEVKTHAVYPPDGCPFDTIVKNNALLIIPKGSLLHYKTADGWKDFRNWRSVTGDNFLEYDFNPISVIPDTTVITEPFNAIELAFEDSVYLNENAQNVYISNEISGGTTEGVICIDDNRAIITFSETIGESGHYTLHIPESVFCDSLWNDSDGYEGRVNSALTYSWNLKFSGIETIHEYSGPLNVLGVDGMLIKNNVTLKDLNDLLPGIYIINGKKYLVK